MRCVRIESFVSWMDIGFYFDNAIPSVPKAASFLKGVAAPSIREVNSGHRPGNNRPPRPGNYT